MSARAEFLDARAVRVVDLNEESSGRAWLLATHLALAHPPGTVVRLVGSSIASPTAGPSLHYAASVVGSSVTVMLPDSTAAVELAATGGHRVAADVRSTDVPVTAKGTLRLTPSPWPLGEPSPWTISARNQRDESGGLIARELLIEMGASPGASLGDSRAAVGVTGSGFQPVLVIDAGGTVTVEGNLEIIGSASEGPIPADLTDPRFVAAVHAVIAERIVQAAIVGSGNAFNLTAVDAATSTPARTDIEITLTPSEELTLWGVAVKVVHDIEPRFVLFGMGNEAASGAHVDITRSIPWVPPLTGPGQARILVAAAAFDAQTDLHTVLIDVPIVPPQV